MPGDTAEQPDAPDLDRARRRRWLVLAVLSGCLALISLDNTIVNVALPRLQEDLGATQEELQWIVDGYSLLFAGSLLLAGSLGDRYGRRLALLVGLVVFGVFSLAATLAGDALVLTLCRAAMGVGGAFIMPSTLSVLTQVFPDPAERGRAIGVWAAVAGAAVALGPILGGLLVEHFDWHAIFLVNPLLVVPLLVAVLVVVPETRDPSRPRLDPLGAVLSTTGLVAIVYSVVEVPDQGVAPATVGAAVGGSVLLALFVVWELRTSAPMLQVRWFAQRVFSVSVGSVAVIYFALFGTMFFVPQFLQLVWSYSPLESGLGVLPLAGGLLLASLLSPRWSARVGARTVVVVGLAAVAVGMGVASVITTATPYVVLGVVLALMGGGLGLALPQATNGILGSVPREKSGSAAAVNDAIGEIGGSLGVAVLGAILAASYRSSIDEAVTRAGDVADRLPGGVLDAVRESLSGAVGAAARVGGTYGEAIRNTAGVAFTNGMTLALLVGAAVPLVAAVVVRLVYPGDLPEASEG
ncbi:MFS transporter [Rhabdothermincola salaria]|uniref:MFS transporter n=1 Tax=Rhabdothermincola salaria TaxID=2903142 RepID=UPI001E4FA398|nr:DHA2 family efflux MFS transporter permease subunit [Rhabdothermincola salaria]